ncbi:MAG: FemAB family XrtA/PEP-CTERM system-associated protein [Pseudomonadota bacterium]
MSVTLRVADLENDGEAIDGYVRAHPLATPFHLSGWSRAVARGCGQVNHYLVAEIESAIVGVLPLTVVHSPLFGRALVSSAFAVGGGALADDGDVANALIAEAVAMAERLTCPTVELRGGMMSAGAGWHHDETTYLGFVRDLAADDEAELLAIPRKQRAEVRRALGFDLIVETGTSEAGRAAHYAVYSESVRNLGTPVFPRALFDAVLDEFGREADILTVRHGGSAIASVLSLYWRGTVMPYWGGGTAAARGWRANDLMYYALMNHARGRGCTRFDFGRSKAGTGPAAFKRNWGFEGEPLAYAKFAADGELPRDINPLNPKYRMQVALWQKLPLSIANRIGPMISRGLG